MCVQSKFIQVVRSLPRSQVQVQCSSFKIADVIEVDCNNVQHLSAFCALKRTGALQGPIRFQLGPVPLDPPMHAHAYAPMAAGYHARCWPTVRSNAGFSVLPKDTSTCGQEDQWMTHWILGLWLTWQCLFG